MIYFLTEHWPAGGRGTSAFRKIGCNFAPAPAGTSCRGWDLPRPSAFRPWGSTPPAGQWESPTTIIPSALDAYWWTVPVLVLSAIRHGIVEEVIVVGYLLDRLGKLGWSTPAAIAASALLRGSYHLYQGFGPFIGNAVMGVVFALVYTRTKRVMPLVIAHAILDTVAFMRSTCSARPWAWAEPLTKQRGVTSGPSGAPGRARSDRARADAAAGLETMSA